MLNSFGVVHESVNFGSSEEIIQAENVWREWDTTSTLRPSSLSITIPPPPPPPTPTSTLIAGQKLRQQGYTSPPLSPYARSGGGTSLFPPVIEERRKSEEMERVNEEREKRERMEMRGFRKAGGEGKGKLERTSTPTTLLPYAKLGQTHSAPQLSLSPFQSSSNSNSGHFLPPFLPFSRFSSTTLDGTDENEGGLPGSSGGTTISSNSLEEPEDSSEGSRSGSGGGSGSGGSLAEYLQRRLGVSLVSTTRAAGEGQRSRESSLPASGEEEEEEVLVLCTEMERNGASAGRGAASSRGMIDFGVQVRD